MTPGFDVRLLRVQPRAHLGEEHDCDVSYAGRVSAVDPRDAVRYPVPVRQHRAVECRAKNSVGWVDMILGHDSRAGLDAAKAGRRVRIRVLTAAGGFADYPIVQLLALGGPAAPGPPRPAAPRVAPGFDFDRVADDSHLVGTIHPCAVDFIGSIEIVDARDGRFRRYPPNAQNRMTVKCKRAGGDAWVDLVFTPDDAIAALQVTPGRTVPLRIATADGGFAGYPVVRWAAPPPGSR